MNVSPTFVNPTVEATDVPKEKRIRLIGPNKGTGRIRVMHVIRYLGLAGTEHGIMKVVNRLDRRVFEPLICCTILATEDAKTSLQNDVGLVVLGESPRGKHRTLILKLRELIRKENIDIVHSHNWATFPHAVVAARLAGVPVVIHGEHGRDEECTSRKWPVKVFLRVMKRTVDQFVAVSDNIADEMETEWKLPSWMIRRIPNGVDTVRFRPDLPREEIRRTLGYTSGDLVIGIVGGLRTIKNHEMLFEAFRLVREELPNCRLSVVGSLANQQRTRELLGKAKSLRIADFVDFLGERNDIPEMMTAFDIYVNSSLYEGMSNTILEAMATGRPVVATRVGGNPMIVEDGVTGCLVPSRDPVSLASAIVDILRNPSRGAAMGRRGRERVEREHSLSAMVRSNEEVYLDNYARYASRRRVTFRQRLRIGGGVLLGRRGLHRLVERVRPAGIIFLTYHRVLPAREKAVTPGKRMVIDLGAFESQMQFLSSNFRLVSVEQAIGMLRGEDPLSGNPIAVTFDDGYRDNFLYAYPIMRKMNIPATIFLATDQVDTGGSFWWDKVSRDLLEVCNAGIVEKLLDVSSSWPACIRNKLEKLSCGGKGAITILDDIVQDMNGLGREERERILADLSAFSERFELPFQERNILSWEEINEMKTAGIGFCNHTASHVFLDQLGEEEAANEIRRASERIHAMTGVSPVAFSYPRGRSDERIRNLVARCGFSAGFTTAAGYNRPGCDMFGLKRLDAGYLVINDRFIESLYWSKVLF